MRSILKKLLVPACVIATHGLLLYGVAVIVPETGIGMRDSFITIEFLPPPPENTPEIAQIPQEPEKSALAGTEENVPETAVEARAFDDAEVAPVPLAGTPDYSLQKSAEAAAGTSGDTRGDGLEFGKLTSDTREILQETPPEPLAKNVPAAEKSGTQGNPDSERAGEFGSGGDGGKSARANVRYRHRVVPKYPRADALAGRAGTVVLLLEISKSGKIKTVSVKQSSGSRTLDAAAISAARASTYVPAQNGAEPIESRAEAVYTFSK